MTSNIMEPQVPSIESAYSKLRPLFFAALGSLARRGFVVTPADSMDLIHDFFAEAWAGLESHFKPDKGSFESYAYGAFVQFVRPRIVRMRRWQNCLIATEELEAFPAIQNEEPEPGDQERVREALANLPEGEQDIVRAYMYGDYTSERALAKELGISRYRLHEILVNALGRLAVSFDRPIGIQSRDWAVALALWRDRRTVNEAATVLRLTPQQVRSAYRRNFAFIAEALKHYQPRSWSPERREKMAARSNTALVLFQKALRSPQQSQMLQDIRANAKEILLALEAMDDSQAMELNLEEVSPQWVAEVYDAIFQGAGAGLQPAVAEAQAREAHEKEDTAIGKAFRDALLADLNDDLRFPAEVRTLREISQKERERLGRAPDVRAGSPESEWWLAHGIRPLTVFYAAKSVSGLLDRYLRRGVLPTAPVVLGDESVRIGDDEKTLRPLSGLLEEEISRRAECSPEIASALYSWLLRVAQYKSWLFAGFEANPQPDGRTVLLTRSDEKFEQTYQRWGLTSFAAARALAASA